MSVPDGSLQSVIADIESDDLVVLITAWDPYNTTKQFIDLLGSNERVAGRNAYFIATRVNHPSSEDQMVSVRISDYTQALESFPAFEKMGNKVLFFLLTTIEDFESHRSAFHTWLAFSAPKKFSTSVIFIPSEKDRAEELPGFGSSVSWIEKGWGLYILRNMEPEEAWGILDAEITRSLGGFGSRLQEEMMVLKFRLYETEEGAALCESLQKLLRESKLTLKEIEDSLEITGNALAKGELMEELRAAYVLYRGEIQDLIGRIASLGIIPGEATIKFFQEGTIES